MKASLTLVLLSLSVFAGGCYIPFPLKLDQTYVTASSDGFAGSNPQRWQRLTADDVMIAYAHRQLYQLPDRDRMYVRVRIQNTTDRGIAVDLTEYASAIRPRQWVPYQAGTVATANSPAWPPQRDVPLAFKQRILREFLLDHLVQVPPKSSVDYYHDFGAPNQPRVNQSDTGQMLVTLGGRIYITDGREVEYLRVTQNCPSSRVIIPAAEPRLVPMGSLIQEPRGPAVLMPATAPSSYLQPEEPGYPQE